MSEEQSKLTEVETTYLTKSGQTLNLRFNPESEEIVATVQQGSRKQSETVAIDVRVNEATGEIGMITEPRNMLSLLEIVDLWPGAETLHPLINACRALLIAARDWGKE